MITLMLTVRLLAAMAVFLQRFHPCQRISDTSGPAVESLNR